MDYESITNENMKNIISITCNNLMINDNIKYYVY